MTPRHYKAINTYLRTDNKYLALKKAGYSENTAKHDVDSVFGREDVKQEIQRRVQRMTEKAQLTDDWIIERLMDIADANIADLLSVDANGKPFYNYKELSPKMRRAIMAVDIDETMAGRGPSAQPVHKIKVRQSDKLRALEMLAKFLGMLKEKVEVTGDTALASRIEEKAWLAESNPGPDPKDS